MAVGLVDLQNVQKTQVKYSYQLLAIVVILQAIQTREDITDVIGHLEHMRNGHIILAFIIQIQECLMDIVVVDAHPDSPSVAYRNNSYKYS